MMLLYYVPGVIEQSLASLRGALARAGDPRFVAAGLQGQVMDAAGIVFPVLAAAAFAGAAVVLAQSRLLFHLGALEPKFSRVSPIAGFKRIFGIRGLAETGKSIVKLLVLGAAIWFNVRHDLPLLLLLPMQALTALPGFVGMFIAKLLTVGLWTNAVFAAIDYGLVFFRHARELRMSKQDIRDEAKDTDGNPHTKARLRRIRMIRARQRMMSKVPTATVVVTNPTHYAVALEYDKSVNAAPRVVAKGVDEAAARIREVARANRVPLVANPPLARALYTVALDADIPAEHYRAVAEIIAYVWRLRSLRG